MVSCRLFKRFLEYVLQAQPFVTWKDIKNQNFKFFGVSTYGGKGKWVILGKLLDVNITLLKFYGPLKYK